MTLTLAERLRKLNADGLIVTVDGGHVGPIPWDELCAVVEAANYAPMNEDVALALQALENRMDEEEF